VRGPFAARFGAGWVTTGKQAETQQEWWKGVTEQVSAFERALEETGRSDAEIPVHRYLSLDAAPVYSLSGVQAFADAAGLAEELGFTDVVVHWPRGSGPYEGHESVLENVVDTVLPDLQGRPKA
jgi:endonuclease IV